MPRPPRKVKEPVQVYLDRPDRVLLDELSGKTGLPRAEVLRRGLRMYAADQLAERAPGWSLEVLRGAMPDGPPDQSVRVDEHLYDERE
jgi:hypothetical protein